MVIETITANLTNYELRLKSFDAVALIYLHLPPDVRALVHQRLFQALRPGGHLILEAFHPRQLGRQSGGAKLESWLYTLDMLRSDLTVLPIETQQELLAWGDEVNLDEGDGHRGLAWVTRWVVRC